MKRTRLASKYLLTLAVIAAAALVAAACSSTEPEAPPTATPVDVSAIIGQVMAAQQPGVTTEDVTAAIQAALAEQPGVTSGDVANEIAKALSARPGVTSADVASAIASALDERPGVTTQDVANEIARALSAQPGVTEDQVANAIQAALAERPGVTEDQVSAIVAQAMAERESQIIAAVTESLDVLLNQPALEVTSEAQYGGILEANQGGNPFTMDTMSDTISAVTHPANQMMEQLFALDSALDAKMMLAESFNAEDGGATWTFTLRENVPFHDGQIMDADDVVASLDRWFHWDTVWGKRILNLLDSIEATDSRTVQIKLTEPFAPMLAALSMSEARQAVIHPADVIAKYKYKDIAEGEEKPRIEDEDIIGTGPYKFVEWVADVKIEMARHEDYAERTEPLSFHSGKKTPWFDGIDINIVPDAGVRLAGLLSGRYDISSPGLDQISTLEDDPEVEPFIAMTGRNESTFNATIPPFDSNLMRQAVAWTLNPKEILQGRAPEGLYELNQSPFYKFQTTWWRDDGWDIYSQVDLDKARSLIEQAGYETPVEIKYIYNPPEQSSGGRATLVVIQQLEDSGLWTVNAEENTWPIHVQVRWEKQHNIMYNGFNPFYQTDLLAPTWNDWEHPASGFLKADRRIELMAQRQRTTDPAEVSRIADDFAEWWWDDVPLFSWGNFATLVGVRKNVQNYRYSGNPVYFGLWFKEIPEDR